MKERVKKNLRRNNSQGDDSNWLTLYGDTMSVLLVFFILLFAISRIDQEKYESVMESMSQALSGRFTIEKRSEPPPGEEALIEKSALIENGLELDEDLEDLASLMEKIRRAVTEEGLEKEVQLSLDHRGVNMMVLGSTFFDSGQADIKEEALPFLRKISSILKSVDYKVLVEGHTDEVPISTLQYPSNWELSTGRACSVVRYFIEGGGIPPGRLSASGYSHYKPRYKLTPENRARNRRVEVVILRQKYSAGEEMQLWN